RTDAARGRPQRPRLPPCARSRKPRPRRHHGRYEPPRCASAASLDCAPRPLYRFGRGRKDPRRVADLVPEVPQGHAGRVPPRSQRTQGAGRCHAGGGIARGIESEVGKVTGFLEYEREDRDYEPVEARIRHWREFVQPLPEADYRTQAARCMNCGVPYCQGTGSLMPGTPGCPVNNQIPDWNDLVYAGNWEEAARNLHSTNNFPEVTGRICPAPCEASCTLNIDENPVTIKSIECAIADRAIAQGLKPEPPALLTGKKVAVIGSGPAGLACAQQLARAGHSVHVYEKFAKAGGLLTYGIPDFKMEKHHVERRVAQMQAEGVVFHCGAHVGVNVAAEKLLAEYDAVVLTG